MSSSTIEQLKILAKPVMTELGFEYLGAELFIYGHHRKLRIFIDKPTGVTVDDCAAVSHRISALLDVEDLIPGEYRLEISSPGFDRPLFELAHYLRFVGRQASVRLKDKIDNRRNLKGVIEAVEGERISMKVDGQSICFQLNDVGRAHLLQEETDE